MDKIRVFFRRVASGSFKRFFRNLQLVHEQSGKNRAWLFVDMVYSMFRYGVGYLDYMTFGFAYIRKDKRLTFMNMDDNIAMVRRLNQHASYAVFDDKAMLYKKFRHLLNRPYVDLRDGFEGFAAFVKGRENFFAKEPVSFGGLGVKKVTVGGRDAKEIYEELMEEKLFLAEETIIQHPEMNKLCASSVNTVRIATVLSDHGNPHVVYALVRIGSGDKEVDNISSGGMYTLLSEDGRITHPTFCDKTVTYYTRHPATGFDMIGFRIPYFQEAIELCKQAALVEPTMRYIGWDIAITEKGPVMVEGNNLPGYDMPQNHRFHDDGCGIKEVFEYAISH